MNQISKVGVWPREEGGADVEDGRWDGVGENRERSGTVGSTDERAFGFENE